MRQASWAHIQPLHRDPWASQLLAGVLPPFAAATSAPAAAAAAAAVAAAAPLRACPTTLELPSALCPWVMANIQAVGFPVLCAGFIPRTYCPDHDPLDVLVLMQVCAWARGRAGRAICSAGLSRCCCRRSPPAVGLPVPCAPPDPGLLGQGSAGGHHASSGPCRACAPAAPVGAVWARLTTLPLLPPATCAAVGADCALLIPALQAHRRDAGGWKVGGMSTRWWVGCMW